jgi:NAD(P)-dependent dehydrogenase (short-subunit alcohol dehydrogenase family)
MKSLLMENRVALITGAGSGMGRASAIKLASEGATVVVADYNIDGAQETAELIKKEGVGGAEAYQIDVTDVSKIREMFDHVGSQYGKLNVLFNHVGSPGPSGIGISEDEYDRTMDVNSKSAFFCTTYGSLFAPLYSMAKGGIVGFTRALALSLAPGIRVNVICPGAVETPMLDGFFGRNPGDDPVANVKAFVESGVPLKRICTPEEIADSVLFLASDMSSFITGVVLPIDGGYTAR